MCMKREHDDYDKSGYPIPMFDFIDLTNDDFIDLTNEDFGDDSPVNETTPRNNQWDYPYNLLSSDENESIGRVFVFETDESNYEEDFDDTTMVEDAVSDLDNMMASDSNQQNEQREFDLDVPQILLSMLTISNNLLERAMQH